MQPSCHIRRVTIEDVVVKAVTALHHDLSPLPPQKKSCVSLHWLPFARCHSVPSGIVVPTTNTTTTLPNASRHEGERHDGEQFTCAYVHISSVARDGTPLRVPESSNQISVS